MGKPEQEYLELKHAKNGSWFETLYWRFGTKRGYSNRGDVLVAEALTEDLLHFTANTIKRFRHKHGFVVRRRRKSADIEVEQKPDTPTSLTNSTMTAEGKDNKRITFTLKQPDALLTDVCDRLDEIIALLKGKKNV